jgi:uncharacterized protein (TIGR03437 family)
VVTAVVNGASGMIQGLPNGGVSQGAIFLIFGSNLGPTPTAVAASPFQTTNLGGTSVSVTVNTTTVNAPLYYASATQVAALLPSSTPTGSGTLTVTYSGTASVAVAIAVVQNNFGTFTSSENGQGVAIATYTDYSLVSSIPGTGSLACPPATTACPYTYSGAANPGDTVILWGTGLGLVSGGDSLAGLGEPVSIPSSTPLKLWLGGVAANVTYAGRSGCCIGEDQIVFTVPASAPTGCAVPLAVQIGTEISNYTAIAVANGSRSCTMQSPAFSSAAVQALTTSAGPINYASFQMGRTISGVSSSGIFYSDIGVANFAQISVTAPNQPEVLSSVDLPPLGTCTTSNSNAQVSPLFSINTGIDAGAIVVTGPPPDFQVTMKEQKGTGQATTYSAVFSQTGVYFSGGAYTIAAAGGADVQKFTTDFTITQTPTWTSADQSTLSNRGDGITRANGITLNWTEPAAAAPYWVVISGSSTAAASDITDGTISASFACWVPSGPGTFTVPASVLLTLPGAADGEIDFKPTLPPLGITATGLDAGFLLFQYDTSFFTPFN